MTGTELADRPWMEIAERLSAYSVTFALVGKAISIYPTEDFPRALVDQGFFEDLPIGPGSEKFEAARETLVSWSGEARKDVASEVLLDLRTDATRLFAGLQSHQSPPWESFYKNKERMIMQDQTLEVREWYARYGYRINGKYSEPEDHIGVEIDFLGETLREAAECEEDTGRAIVRDAVDFIVEHPATFVAEWDGNVQKVGRTGFYKGIASLSEELLHMFVEEFGSSR